MSTSIGHGLAFAIGDGASPTEAFTTVAQVLSLSFSGVTRDAVEVTHMSSTDKYREFIPGLLDAGSVSFELNFAPGIAANWDAIKAEFAEGAAGNKRVTFPAIGEDAAEVFNFSGFVTSTSIEAPLDDRMTISVEYKITGKPSFMATS